MADHLDELALRLQDDPYFLACPLHYYAKSEGLDETTMAEKFACTHETLVFLRLCRAPCGSGKQFRKDVDRIATKFQVDSVTLAEAIRRGQAILQLTGKTADVKGTLLAARDPERKSANGNDRG